MSSVEEEQQDEAIRELREQFDAAATRLRSATPAWFVAAPLAVVGAVWLVVLAGRSALSADRAYEWLPYLNHSLGPFLAGWLIGRMASRRQLEIAVAGGVGSVLVLALVFLVPSFTRLSWAPGRSDSPWLMVGVFAVVSAVAALGGAWVGRRQGPPRSRWPAWFGVSAALTMGVLVTVMYGYQSVAGPIVGAPPAAALALMLGGVLLAGAVAQLLAPHRMNTACGAGAAVFSLLQLERVLRGDAPVAPGIAKGVLISAMLVPIGMLGAWLAYRLARLPEAPDDDAPDLPRAVI